MYYDHKKMKVGIGCVCVCLCLQVVLVGLDSAGKSTLLARLLTGQVSPTQVMLRADWPTAEPVSLWLVLSLS